MFEKLRLYDDAVKLLKVLLSQNIYLPDYHGLWYERLALDVDQHLKQPKVALKIIEDGLKDENVRVAR